MITLFCDLDNTLIYSHRRIINAPKRVAEMLNGAEQSYITERTFGFLSACKPISIIPVTTRTFQQYERVKSIIELLNCQYALILNGAVLVKHGMIDDLWLNESRELVKDAEEEMRRVTERLATNKAISIKYHDEFLTYASASNPQHVSKQLNDSFDQSLVHSFFDSRKVYCTPTILTKGNAIKRLSSHIKPELTLAVGDSENDLSMLAYADIPIVPNTLSEMVSNPNKVIIPQGQILSDATCDVLERIIGNSDR